MNACNELKADGWPKAAQRKKDLEHPGDRVCFKCRVMSDGKTLCGKCLTQVQTAIASRAE
jgi:hypothetical protein